MSKNEQDEVQLSDEKLRNILNELVAKNGLKETKDFISTGEYPQELKNRAMEMLQNKPSPESLMAEGGDISELD